MTIHFRWPHSKASYFSVIFLLIMIFFFSSMSIAGLYSWKDENGVIHFSDDPPPEMENTNKDNGFKEIIRKEIFQIPYFTVSHSFDPNFLFSGTYMPYDRTSESLPCYIKKDNQSTNDDKKKLYLEAVNYHGKWQWVLKQNYREKYYSNFAPDGTPPDRMGTWLDHPSYRGKECPVIIKAHTLSQSKAPENCYIYDRRDIPESSYPWINMAYEISGIQKDAYNGTYRPVTWTSAAPRFKNTTFPDVFLTAENLGDQWRWLIIDGKTKKISSQRVDKDTYPENIKGQWYEVAGELYFSIHIREISHGKTNQP